MILVALHTKLKLADGDGNIEDEIVRLAQDLGDPSVAFYRYDNPLDFIERASSTNKALIDIALVPYVMPGITGIQALCDVENANDPFKSVIFADTPDHAVEASICGVDGYLLNPVSTADFTKTMRRIISSVIELHQSSIILNARDDARRVRFDTIVYCETSGHNQIIHFLDKSSLTGRYSSQALFELLSDDARFFKAGSSYIINTDEIVEAHITSGAVKLSNGTAITVPSRLRKSLEAALMRR